MTLRALKHTTLILALLALAPALEAQTTPSATELAEKYFGLLQKEDFQGAAQLFDPAALAEFRGSMSFLLELPEEARGQFFGIFFGPEATVESVKALSDPDFFAAFLKSVLAQAGGVSFDGLQVIGEVAEGTDQVHVVTRNQATAAGISIEAMEVVSFKRSGEGPWAMQMSGRFKGVAEQLKNALGAAAQPSGGS
ncbi:MAG: hypothetical protein AAF725_04180 [Acidobacteriota bacterium]